MPKLRKGVLPRSSRHIRRIAAQNVANDEEKYRNISSPLPTINDDSSSVASTTAMHTVHTLSNTLSTHTDIDIATTSTNVIEESILHESTSADMQAVDNSRDLESFKLSFDDKQDSHLHENLSDYDSDCINRYSDSDAESISDVDESVLSEQDIEINFAYYRMMNSDSVNDKKFVDEITTWAKQYQIGHNAIKALLSILNSHTETTFPKDPRTLLNTPVQTPVIPMGSGSYCHMGLDSALKKIIKSRVLTNDENNLIKLMIFVDGAPLYSSSEKGLWVILCKESLSENVFVVGIYHGISKPNDPNEFLKPFVDEMSKLINDGFEFNEKTYNIQMYALICDSPAKSFVLNTKYHSGYHSCSKCNIEGEFVRSVCFPVENMEELENYCHRLLRTHENFERLEYLGYYQRGPTILTRLRCFDVIDDVPLDVMHLLYLGIVRLLIRFWIGDKGRRNKAYKLSNENIVKISDRLENLKGQLPQDFNRRSRSLTYWKLWKATEFRHFLLYFGPAILRDVLPRNIFDHFLLLHISFNILTNKALMKNSQNIDLAEGLLLKFVFDFQNIYGEENVAFNVHNCIHVVRDVRKYGPAENFSAFPFESYLCTLKKLVRKTEKPLQQIARRLSEYESLNSIKNYDTGNKNRITVEKSHYNGILTNNRTFHQQYKSLTINSWSIHINVEKDSCVMLNDRTIVNVMNIAKSDQLYLIGKRCIRENDLYKLDNIYSGKLLDISIVKECDNIEDWPCSKIRAKIFKILGTGKFAAFPIVHTIISH